MERQLPILLCLALLRCQEFATAVSPSTLLRPSVHEKLFQAVQKRSRGDAHRAASAPPSATSLGIRGSARSYISVLCCEGPTRGAVRGAAFDSQDLLMRCGSTRGAGLESQNCSMQFDPTRGAALDSQDSCTQSARTAHHPARLSASAPPSAILMLVGLRAPPA